MVTAASEPHVTTSPGPIVGTYTCACGHCGLEFTITHAPRGQRRKYSLDCPYREERALAQRRKASRASYERRRQESPRRCACGCGRELPRYVRFHPDCETRAGKEQGRQQPAKPGKSRRCGDCYDQPWRRDPQFGCIRCGGKYRPEPEKKRDVPMQSSLGHVVRW